MKIGVLKKDQRDFFADMDPFLMLERLDLPGYFALAATEIDGAGARELPAGLLLGVMLQNKIIIEWVYVQKDYRNRGIGEQLIHAVFRIAAQNGLTSVCAYINQEYGRELACPNEELFLEAYCFSGKQALAGEWITDLRTLSGQDYFRQPTDNLPFVMPLQQLTSRKAREAIHALALQEHAALLCPVTDQRSMFDEELSFLLSSKGEIYGGILVQGVSRNLYAIDGEKLLHTGKETVLYPVSLCAQSPNEERALLSAALQAAMKKYAKDTEVHILLRTNRCNSLMEKLGIDDAIACSMLTADVEEYFNQEVLQDGYLFL